MLDNNYDITIIGAGIVGMSVAMQLKEKYNHLNVCVLEKENDVAKHQTGHNSGVIHSGIYYKPGSLKAKNTQEGITLLHNFCDKNNIPYQTCGKIIIATTEKELPLLENLMQRGIENGLQGLRFLEKDEIKKIEPSVKALRAIHIPITGIIDYTKVTKAYKKVFESYGGKVLFNNCVTAINNTKELLVITTNESTISTKYLINCAGLFSDRIARLSGIDPKLKIIPFRGEYFKIKKEKQHLVNNLVYPVPDPEFPFLGVHFTRMINGEREVGPNAVPAFKREGYTKTSFSIQDMIETLSYPSFWIMGIKYIKMGVREMFLSFCKPAYVKEVKKMIPQIKSRDLIPAKAGVRAQALEQGGKLVDDFRIIERPNMIHVLNSPSPAATASLAIGKQILEKAEKTFQL